PAGGNAGAASPTGEEWRVLRRAGGAVLLPGPQARPPAVGGPWHVHAERHAAGGGARTRHLPTGILGPLSEDGGGVRGAAGRPHGVFRHGDGLSRRGASD